MVPQIHCNGSLTFKDTTILHPLHVVPKLFSSNFAYFIQAHEVACFAHARAITVGAERHARQMRVCVRARILALATSPYRSLARLPRKLQVVPLTYFEVGSSQGGTSEKTRKNHVNWNP